MVMLTAFGNAAGLSAHWDHGKPHGSNLFLGLVGPTSGKKGTATGIGSWLMGEAEPLWRDARIQRQGFGSGEGLVWAVRDAQGDDIGVQDKRLLVIEEEWAKAFALAGSDSSILSPIIRSAYDRQAIGKSNKGENAYGCRHPHISIVANITPSEFGKVLNGKHAGSLANGFVNRFLLCWTDRVRFLPRGGNWKAALKPFVQPIADALTHASTVGLLALDEEAGSYWDEVYERLEAHPDNLFGMATARASDQVMKLALVYALTDKASAIGLAHLKAALACWAYCEATAKRLFIGSTPDAVAEPEPLWLRLLSAIQAEPGILRSTLTRITRAAAEDMASALNGLRGKGWAYCRVVQNPNGGPKAEAWYPGNEGDEPRPHNPHPPLETAWVVQPDGLSPETGRKELTPSTSEGGLSPETGRKELTASLTPGELVLSFPASEATPLDPEPKPGELVPSFPPEAEAPTPQAALSCAVGEGGCEPDGDKVYTDEEAWRLLDAGLTGVMETLTGWGGEPA